MKTKCRTVEEQLRDLESYLDGVVGQEMRRTAVVKYLELVTRIASDVLLQSGTELKHAQDVLRVNHGLLVEVEVLRGKVAEMTAANMVLSYEVFHGAAISLIGGNA